MSDKSRLRQQRAGTVINASSKKQESALFQALRRVEAELLTKFGPRIRLAHSSTWHLKDIVAELRLTYPDIAFRYRFESSSMRPDGGILSVVPVATNPFVYPILISEVKNQGTNDQRQLEGKPRQAKGNAIERLGKNLIGLRTALLRESIFPFVCFGYGCDFEETSSILDRVSTMAMFGELNVTHLHNDPSGRFNRGSFYFRPEQWKVDEMAPIMLDIAERSVMYYQSKYGEATFLHTAP